MNELDILARKYGTDKRTNDAGQNIYHGYTDIYYELFKEYQHIYNSVLEIGIRDGYSHLMWKEFFQNATIYGLDRDDCSFLNQDRLIIYKGDQGDCHTLIKYFGNLSFDLIIDDGSHQSWNTQKSFKCLFPLVKSGGYYIIEDLATGDLREFREYDDIKSETREWLRSIQNNRHYSYYMTNTDIKDIASVIINGELGIIRKK